MTQGGSGQGQTQQPSRKRLSVFIKAMLFTAIPIFILCAGGAPGAIAPDTTWPGFAVILAAAWGLWGIAIVAAIVLAIAKKRQIASGVLTGAAIALVGVGATCFTLINNMT